MSFQSRPIFDDDDPFWEQYNSLNDAYKAQLRPYLYYNYTPSAWDQFREFAFGRSNDYAMREQAQLKAWEQLGILQNDVFQNDLNSIQSQVSRERNAGLNPDLTGDVQGELAAGQEQPMNPPVIDFLTPPPAISQNLIGLFQSASQLAGAASQFGQLFSQKPLRAAQTQLTSEQIAGQEISNISTAHDALTKFLSGIHPDTWKTYAPDGKLDSGLVKQAFDDLFSDAPVESKKYLDAAFNRVASDPRIMQQYYDAATKAIGSRLNYLGAEDTMGSLDFVDQFIRKQATDMLGWTKAGLKLQLQYNNAMLEFGRSQAANNADLEHLRAKYKIPEAIVQGEEAQYLAMKYRQDQNKRTIEAEQKWLEDMQSLARDEDPSVRNAALYLIQCYFAGQAPAMQTRSASGNGSFGLADVFTISGGGSSSSSKPLNLPFPPSGGAR